MFSYVVSRRRWWRLSVTGLTLLMATSLLVACSFFNLPWTSNPPASGDIFTKADSREPITDLQLPVPQYVFTSLNSPDRQVAESDPSIEVPGFSQPPPGTGYARYFSQPVYWGECPGDDSSGVVCAKVLAPLDWFDPDGRAITLAMKRRLALGPKSTPDSPDLFINPGGPGGSAQDYVDYFPAVDLDGFNIVGLDPRGSGESTPVVCGSDAEIDAYFELTSSPKDAAQKQALIDGVTDFARQCRQHSGDLLDHISTIEAVYDFDMVRYLLGNEKFNWFGVSYGTYIGAVYLELYPEKAGRMILDAAVSIDDPLTEAEVPSQAEGFEQALNKYAKWAVSQKYGDSEKAVIKQITDFISQLEKQPLVVGQRKLTSSLFVTGLALYMYLGESAYRDLAFVIDATIASQDGSMMLRAADALNGREKSGYGPMATAFPSIHCLDWADNGLSQSFLEWKEIAKKAPFFGHYMGPGVVCEVWTAKPAAQIDFRGANAPTFLVIGGTGDNATPYQYAESMAKILPSAILVTRDGVGHGSHNSGSSCIDKIVWQFLGEGIVPADGIVCPMD